VRPQSKKLVTGDVMPVGLQQRSALGCELVTEVAHSFGEVCLQVTGSSMIPAIWPGDVVAVRRSELGKLRPGQIVLYRQERGLVAHRIVHIQGNLLTTRGDTLWDDDPPVKASDLVGQVLSLVRNGQRVNLRQSSWQRISASILRHSDLCLRMTLRLGLRLRRQGTEEMA
jgi:signal peptidase I